MTSLKSFRSKVSTQTGTRNLLYLDVVLFRPDILTMYPTDWDDTETELGKLSGLQPGATMSGGDRLWEDNWDDDDVEEDFSIQLRWVPLHSSGIKG
jgi:hypothetical protein